MENVLPTRKKNRLPFFDYSESGGYFITICTHKKACILSRIDPKPPTVRLTAAGEAVDTAICEIPDRYSGVFIENRVIMPNHVHILFRIERGKNGAAIPRIIQQLKSSVTKALGTTVWQKGFYDHVIRNADDFMVKYVYIDENPAKWLLRRDEYCE